MVSRIQINKAGLYLIYWKDYSHYWAGNLKVTRQEGEKHFIQIDEKSGAELARANKKRHIVYLWRFCKRFVIALQSAYGRRRKLDFIKWNNHQLVRPKPVSAAKYLYSFLGYGRHVTIRSTTGHSIELKQVDEFTLSPRPNCRSVKDRDHFPRDFISSISIP